MQKRLVPTEQDIQVLRQTTNIDQYVQCQHYRNNAQEKYKQFPAINHKSADWRFLQLPEIAWEKLTVQDVCIPPAELVTGVTVTDLRDYKNIHDLHEIFLNRYATFVDAAWNRGYVINISKNAQIDQVINVHQVISHYNAQALIEKVVIVIEQGAQVIIKDVLNAISTQVATNIRTLELIIHDYAHVTFLQDQDLPEYTCNIATVRCVLGYKSTLIYEQCLYGSNITKSWLEINLNGEYANAQIRGAYILKNNQQVEMNVKQCHNAQHAVSNVIFKGVLADESQSVYQGTVFIDKKAAHSDAAQNNKNILLHNNARAYSIPNLEVLNNDVQCAHGSAVGPLDQEQLFYLQSRGLSKNIAHQILLIGFLQNIFKNSTHFPISDRIKQIIL